MLFDPCINVAAQDAHGVDFIESFLELLIEVAVLLDSIILPK